jgi:hypothetical protein
MPAWMLDEWDRLRRIGLDPQPTGSRLFCPESVRGDSDWDVMVRASSEQVGAVWDRPQWTGGGSPVSECLSIKQTRSGQSLNIIMFEIESEYDAFECATRLCTALCGPTAKQERVLLFERVRTEKWHIDDLRPDGFPPEWPQEPADLAIAADCFYAAGDELKGDFLREPTVWPNRIESLAT